jgi:hypothetical protein
MEGKKMEISEKIAQSLLKTDEEKKNEKEKKRIEIKKEVVKQVEGHITPDMIWKEWPMWIDLLPIGLLAHAISPLGEILKIDFLFQTEITFSQYRSMTWHLAQTLPCEKKYIDKEQNLIMGVYPLLVTFQMNTGMQLKQLNKLFCGAPMYFKRRGGKIGLGDWILLKFPKNIKSIENTSDQQHMEEQENDLCYIFIDNKINPNDRGLIKRQLRFNCVVNTLLLSDEFDCRLKNHRLTTLALISFWIWCETASRFSGIQVVD